MTPSFIHLRTRSSYSLGQGAMKIADVVALAKEKKMPAVALTDKGNLYAALEFALAAVKEGVQPIVGVILKVQIGYEKLSVKQCDDLLILCSKEAGFLNLLELVSSSFLENEGKSESYVTLEKLLECREGLIILAGYSNLFKEFALSGNSAHAKDYVRSLKEGFVNNLYLEIVRTEEDDLREDFLLELALDLDLPIVATNDVYFSKENMHEAQDILSCISSNRYFHDEERPRLNREHYFKSPREMAALYEDLPEALENTVNIAKKCAFFPESRDPILPSFPTGKGRSEYEELTFQAQEGLKLRLADNYYDNFSDEQRKEYDDRLAYELEIIGKMGFPGYFLIVSDFIKWSKDHNIPVGPGRGSGAGSLVAYVLKITDLDPLRFGLLFERFLNPQRVSMPDFDIDFCQERRDEVIKYVQQKYGKEKVAHIITFGKLQAKAVLKDVGRVLQMPYKRVDEICKMIPFNPVNPVTLEQAISMDKQLQSERDNDPEIAKLLGLGLKLEGLHRHTSTHAAGIVIGDRNLAKLIPLYKDARSSMPVVQYSMKYTELAGLVKFDFLGLKTLTTIAKTVDLLKKQNIEVDIDHIPLDDEKTYKLLGAGESVGIFQLESAGMRDCIKKMKPDKLEDIIALISLYRPGPMDNIPSYIARKHGKEDPAYPHPLLEECLEETFGVIIYQEQVMQIAQILAGYSLGDADLLRRAMGKKIKAEMDAQREIFVSGALKNNIKKEKASEIFDLVAKFAGYGFNKSHAAAYALIGYQTAYLKANYPVEFMAAIMNMDLHDTDKLNFFIQEVKRMNINIMPPSVNYSTAHFSVDISEGKKSIVYGLGALKAVGVGAAMRLVSVREEGKFKDIYDFVERCGPEVLNKRMYESLVNSGSLDCLEENRKMLLVATEMLIKYAQQIASEKESQQSSLFDFAETDTSFKPKLKELEDFDNSDRLKNEFAAVGFYLTKHPLDSYVTLLSSFSVIMSSDFADKILSEQDVNLVGVIISYRQRSGKNGRFTTIILSDPTGLYEISIFDSEIIEKCRSLFINGQKVFITGLARKDEGGVRIMARELFDLDDYVKRKEHVINIHLSEEAKVEDIVNRLSCGAFGMAIRFLIKIHYKDYEVKLQTKQSYKANLHFLDELEKLKGVSLIG